MTECSVDACDRDATKRSFCDLHYKRWRKHGDPSIVKKAPNGTYFGCSVHQCDRPHACRGLCAMHYNRQRYHGDPLAGGPPRIIGDREARFLSHVDNRGPDECWPWTASITPNGYGQFFDGRLVPSHRVALEMATGQVVSDLFDVDHVCHNRDLSCGGGTTCLHRRCCNPAHLEAVSHKTNVNRGRANWQWNTSEFAGSGPR